MADIKPPTTMSLTWTEGLRFEGRIGRNAVALDGEAEAAPSPMQALAAALTGCMAVDVVSIIHKGRHPLQGLTASFTGRRADGQPARFVSVSLHYVVSGSVPTEAIERAIQLSRDKYCSVWHSMRDDIDFDITFEVRPDY